VCWWWLNRIPEASPLSARSTYTGSLWVAQNGRASAVTRINAFRHCARHWSGSGTTAVSLRGAWLVSAVSGYGNMPVSGWFAVLVNDRCRAVLTSLGALGPPGWWGPYHPYGPRGRVGAVVLCTSESGNTHLGPNQGQTWCQITISEMGLNLL